jgi:hypothetical protein
MEDPGISIHDNYNLKFEFAFLGQTPQDAPTILGERFLILRRNEMGYPGFVMQVFWQSFGTQCRVHPSPYVVLHEELTQFAG